MIFATKQFLIASIILDYAIKMLIEARRNVLLLLIKI